MDGVFVNKKNATKLEAGLDTVRLTLLAKSGDLEIMEQMLVAGAIVWLKPAEDLEAMEFFLIQSGQIEFDLDGEYQRLTAGDSFYVSALSRDILVKTPEETKLLYISNRPIFDSIFGFQDDLTKLLVQINEKDNYTYKHSCSVMRYSVKLFEALPDFCRGMSTDDIVVASLFHDVGKCFEPDSVLKKNGRLEGGDFRYIRRHPIDSARLLKPHFGDGIAEIAQNHHERMDGSGYPFGLEGRDISHAARIVAVADCFDAMTSDRGYNEVMSFEASSAELFDMKEKYDRTVTQELEELVKYGKIAE